MFPNAFDYHAPATLGEALGLLKTHGDDARVLAGGHSLIPLMKLRFAAPAVLIDLGQIPNLSAIRAENGALAIGALTIHYAIESSELLKEKCPLLPETAAEIGDPQVRNRGTIGGSLAHADPAADWPAAVLALNAELDIVGPNGARALPVAEFFVDLLTTALEPGEILTGIRIPEPPPNSGGAYVKMHQSASGFAIAGVAAHVTLNADGSLASVAVGITGISPVPYRAGAVEDALTGKTPGADAIRAASEQAVDGVDEFQEDHHASSAYRQHLARTFTRRALTRAIEQAG